MLVSTTIVASCCLLSLTIAQQPFQGYEPANFINIYDYLHGFHDTGFFGQNPYANYDAGVEMYHQQSPQSAYHHPPQHQPPQPHHPSPPHHPLPPQRGHFPPPPSPFRKPPFPHHSPYHQHYLPPNHQHYSPPTPPSPNYNNFGPWHNQGNVNGVGAETNTNQAIPVDTTTATNAFRPNPSQQQQTSQVNTIVSGIFPGVSQTSIQTITSTGTTISASNNGLISGIIGQPNRPQINIQPSQQTDQKNVNTVALQRPSTTISSTSVNNLISGVFPSLTQQGGNNGNVNVATSTDRNVNDIVAGVFPSINQQQNNQPRPFQTTSVNNLIGGVFPNLAQQGGNNNANVPLTGINQPPQPTQITSSTQTNVNNLISGVFPSLAQQGQQNSAATTSSYTANTLISGVFKGFQGGNKQTNPLALQPTNSQSTFPSQLNSIPVFQPDIQPVSNNAQNQPTKISIVGSTSTSTSTIIQPATIGTTTTNANGDSGTINGDVDDEPVFDIDIRLGPDGDEVDNGRGSSQRNRTVTS